MKILYDYQAFDHQRVGGVSRYFDEMIAHLPASVEKEIAVWRSGNHYLQNRASVPNLLPEFDVQNHFIPAWHSPKKASLFKTLGKWMPERFPYAKYLNKKRAAAVVAQGKYEVFHPTYFDPYFLKYIGNRPFVLTIHDMIDEVYQVGTTTPKRKALLAEKAAHIITVSEYTKRDVMRLLHIPEERISVVYHGASLPEAVPAQMPDLPERYLLFVGNRARSYKNFAFFVEALPPLMQQYDDLQVICVGSPFTKEEQALLSKLDLSHRVQCLTASDSQLYTLYHQAICLVFPSEYEGFGIPILEAFQAECPVVLSRSSCFPEIAGEAALYFENRDAAEMRQVIISLLDQPDRRACFKQLGTERLKLFSWETAAEQTCQVYQKVMETYGQQR